LPSSATATKSGQPAQILTQREHRRTRDHPWRGPAAKFSEGLPEDARSGKFTIDLRRGDPLLPPYEQRDLIERLFCNLTHFSRIATLR